MARVKVAMVGCGGIARWHLSRIKDYDDVELVGFMDVIPERADSMAKTAGSGAAYASYVEMLDKAKPEALYICVPPAEHGEIEFEAIKRGIHLLIQKPVALSTELAGNICEKAEKAGIVTCVGHQDRYLNLVDEVLKWIPGREIGLVTASWVGGVPGVPWWRKRSTSGGQIVEQHIHHFDLLRFFLGEPARVYAAGGKGIVKPTPELEGYDVDDYSVATITFKSGIIATVLTGDYFKKGAKIRNGVALYAADGSCDYELRQSLTITDAKGAVTINNDGTFEHKLDRAFLHAVATGDRSQIRSTYADTLKTLRLTLACNESMDTGKPVDIN